MFGDAAKLQNATHLKQRAVFCGAGLSCLFHLGELVETFFGVSVTFSFSCDFGRLFPPKESLLGSITADFVEFALTKRAENEA